MRSGNPVVNFGGNVRFTPPHVYVPATEADVLAILDRHAGGQVRVAGTRHSWSPAIVSTDALLDLHRLNRVELDREADGTVWATVGGGCRVKHLVRILYHRARVTLPSIGLIAEQTIAGAISTATHGSGRHSLSHYAAEIRVAAFDPETGRACIHTFTDGTDLQAARCALGCMGVILTVRFRCVPAYDVSETIEPCATLEDVLKGEAAYPLQQFFLLPHRWTFFVQRRVAAAEPQLCRSVAAMLYRAWWLAGIDVALHVVLKLLAGRKRLTQFFYRRLLSGLILSRQTITDRSDRMLTMKHDLFRHLEIELYVPAVHLADMAAFVRAILDVAAGTTAATLAEIASQLESVGMLADLTPLHGTFTHHYPITFRKVRPDEALIATSSGRGMAWYAVSFITLEEPRDSFLTLAAFLARAAHRLFDARPHWGKFYPLTGDEVAATYPQLPEFRSACRRVDPRGVFRNAFANRVLFGGAD